MKLLLIYLYLHAMHISFSEWNDKDKKDKKGDSFKYVRTEGGGGFGNCQIMWTNSTDRLREMRTKGEGGPKSQNLCGRTLWKLPKYEDIDRRNCEIFKDMPLHFFDGNFHHV